MLDGEGKAMHKSLGNAIEPEEIIKKHGAEILRLWTASVDSTRTCACRETILTRLVEAYRKLRNTFRYMLGNLSDFDPATDAVPAGELTELDQWILLRAEDLVARCRAWYDDFEFHKVYHARLRLRDGGPELRLLRRAEGPALYLAPRNRRRGAARRPRSTGCSTPWSACSRPS